jgi:hypothetical protein
LSLRRRGIIPLPAKMVSQVFFGDGLAEKANVVERLFG